MTYLCLNKWANIGWIRSIKDVLDHTGLSLIWNYHFVDNSRNLSSIIENNLKDQFLQQWNSDREMSNKGKMYLSIKQDFAMEEYLRVLPSNLSRYLCWFRTANHKLSVETGRWNKIDYDLRKCDMCTSNEIGDEYHTLLKCSAFANIRDTFIPKYFSKYPSKLKFQILMTETRDKKLWANIAKFIREIFNYRKTTCHLL